MNASTPAEHGTRLDEWKAVFRQFPQVVRLVWKAYPVAVIVIPLFAVIAAPVPAVVLFAWKRTIDGVTLWMEGDAAGGRTLITLFLLLSLGLAVIRTVLTKVQQYYERLLQLRLTDQIKRQIIDRATSLDLAFYESSVFYDKLMRAKREAGFRPFTTIRSAVGGISSAATLASYIVVLATLAWWSVPLVIALAIPGLFVQVRYGRMGYFMIYERTQEERVRQYVEEVLTSDRQAKEVRLFGLASYLLRRWRDLFHKFFEKDVDLARRRMVAELAATLFQTTAGIGFYVFVIYRTITDPVVTVGSMVMYTQAMERGMGSVGSIFNTIADLYNNNLYIRNLFEFLEQRPTIVTKPNPAPLPNPIRDGIAFEGVTFTYPGSDSEVLHNVSLTIRPGERIALVGENGAGKTTLIKLLARLYDPDAGRILVDGVDLRDLDIEAWQREIGIIFQDFVRYHLTARENVGFGQIDALDDLERIERAAALSGADAIVSELEIGWDTVLGKRFEDGKGLSGGEWQRIALARAFLRDAQILALDEPTAALDAKQEYETFMKFNELTQDKTTIVISHRFSTVRMVDRIYVIEEGRIVEEGSHDQLVTIDGRYAELFHRQAHGYR